MALILKRLSLLALLVVTGCIPFGDAWLSFDGVVTDAAGRPVEGAKISALANGRAPGHGKPVFSRGDGYYSYHADSCPCDFEFVLYAEKEGYKQYSVTMGGAQANAMRKHDIVLQAK